MMKSSLSTICLLLTVLMMGCTATSYLAEDEKYYSGATVVYKKKKHLENAGEVTTEVNRLLLPEPNSKLLGSRPRVWFYEIAGDVKKDKGFKHWLKTKLGRKPVLLEDLDAERVRNQIESTLRNNGFFGASVDYDIKKRSNSGRVIYNAQISSPFHYDTIINQVSDSILKQNIITTDEESILGVGKRYDLDKLKTERARIEKSLKDRGFYHFDDQYLLFRADSTIGDKQIKMLLTLKETTPDNARQVYKISEVNMYADYAFKSQEKSKGDTTQVKNLNYIHSTDEFRPEIIADQVTIRPGNIYRKEDELITLNRLIQLDVFKYVNVDYEEIGDNELRSNIYMSSYKKKSIRLELQA
ncbi:hypothetical protein E1176_07735, partial [Fulvivirga sp. RKSG066]|uniref:hypothetical protein n=1 Tax=Fulvivirga aurantia TaxID=2529383 RepID=UPI001CA3968D